MSTKDTIKTLLDEDRARITKHREVVKLIRDNSDRNNPILAIDTLTGVYYNDVEYEPFETFGTYKWVDRVGYYNVYTDINGKVVKLEKIPQ